MGPKWDEFWWWVILTMNVFAAFVRAFQGQFYETALHATVAVGVHTIIRLEREIRRLRARPKDTEYFVIRPPS